MVREALFEQQFEALFHGSLIIQVDEIIEDSVVWTLAREPNLSNYAQVGSYQGHPVRIFITVPMGAVPSFSVMFISPNANTVNLLALGIFPNVSPTLPAQGSGSNSKV